MHIIISNDDGYTAAGITALAEGLAELAELTVVAPDRDRSGASNSLTLEYPIRATEMANGFFRVDGTPTDCVHLAITGLIKSEADMVVSGINAGANLGDDVLYSGTVAAAMEGRFLGLPSLAVSLLGPEFKHFDSAVKVVKMLIKCIHLSELPVDTLLNVNVPDLPWDDIAGLQATRLGHRHKAEPVIKSQDPRGRNIYWVGPPGKEKDEGEGTDFYAVKHNYVSITPIKVDLTRHDTVSAVANWLKKI
ncbi:5'-nucleotidase SurE [hydrothermal vent metagenome]|uniref:5'-nucleotidase n=1 Tax=hydrothermal vent metagenome TaxID=652676 RepID=A0A3B1A6W3_9ZZZZ